MNVQDALRKFFHKIRRQQPHVSRETNEINISLAQSRDDQFVVSFALETFGRNDARFDSARTRSLDSLRSLPVAHDNRNFSVGNASRGNAFRQRLKIRTAPGKQDANVLFHQ